jgi:hypothetical protein
MRQGAIAVLAASLLTAACSRYSLAADEALPNSRLGFRTAPLLLLSREDVRADVKLDAQQSADAEIAIRTLYARALAIKGMTGERALAERQKIDDEQWRWLERNLTEAQFTRIIQVDLQWEGPSALVRPTVAKALGLTPEQKTILKSAIDQYKQKRYGGKAGVGEIASLSKQALNVLSPPQREQWLAMLGQPFVPRLAATVRPGEPARR